MTVHVHIERLVLDDRLVGNGDARSVRAALGSELTQLLQGDPLGAQVGANGSRPRIDAGQLGVAAADAGALGRQVAGALHRGLVP
jgi:hypothetical protein